LVSSQRDQEAPDNEITNQRKATMSLDLLLCVILIVMLSVVIGQNIGLKERMKKLESLLHR
jgi:hypothetical protein